MPSTSDSNSTSLFLHAPQLTRNIVDYHHRQTPLQLGIMASGTGSTFEAIAHAIQTKKLNAQIQAMVYNNPNAGVVEKAKQWNIPAILLNHRNFQDRESLDKAIVTTLQQYQVDWVIMAGWMRRVTNTLIHAFPQHILNVHPSLLPSFPGLHAVQQALNANVAITGCTIHHVVLAVDSGPIVMQAAVPILPNDTESSLHHRIHKQEHIIYPKAIILAATSI